MPTETRQPSATGSVMIGTSMPEARSTLSARPRPLILLVKEFSA
jgi:hypothetical protein